MASGYRLPGKRRGRPATVRGREIYCLECGLAGKLHTLSEGICQECRARRLRACIIYDREARFGEIPLNLTRGEDT